jgi:hypothetical protein
VLLNSRLKIWKINLFARTFIVKIVEKVIFLVLYMIIVKCFCLNLFLLIYLGGQYYIEASKQKKKHQRELCFLKRKKQVSKTMGLVVIFCIMLIKYKQSGQNFNLNEF